jgi:hypothetical protein
VQFGGKFISFPPQKKKNPTTWHTLAKPHEPTLKPKLCQKVKSCLRMQSNLIIISCFLRKICILAENNLIKMNRSKEMPGEKNRTDLAG